MGKRWSKEFIANSLLVTWLQMFLVHHFVSYPKPGSKYAKHSQGNAPKPSITGAPSLTTPSTPSLINTPTDGLSRVVSSENVNVRPYFLRPQLRKVSDSVS